MKIAHIITRLVRGGADENTMLSCNAQAAAGGEVHLIYGCEYSKEMLARAHPDVRLHEIASLQRAVSPIKDLRAVAELRKLLARIDPDIVHTHTSKAGIVGRAAARLAGRAGIVHGVHILPFVNVTPTAKVVYLGLEKALAPITHAFVNVSAGMQDIGLQHGVGRADRHFVVPSGMSVKDFRSASPFTSEELKERLGDFPPGGRILVFVAALEPRKRQYEFLDVFKAVQATVGDVQLVLLGEGHDRQRLTDRVEALDLQGSVRFAGFSSEVERWIATAAVCVFASEREGLPRAVIQYALGARPVVSTDLPGIEAVVKNGESGFLVPIDDLEAMVKPIVRLLEDRQLAETMSAAARKLDLSAWDEAAMAASLDRIYADILKARLPERQVNH